ncbi:SMI1/KNR4 family protein [Pseudochryseolinea flava]|uniref:Knr4/Smi1-like domain-containing protein n=1 Tax=Pseudochryseolinea flava TaxID=2059302 RepID=A0A364Y4S6_9BACT|nr:SMI1/KNR4 family protein [Pseudochryseolinea flava]RAW01823.1 hypothetical protein DQQ10_09270 [Pseudochryseolinea flava]
MREHDIQKIEQALLLKLPEHYVAFIEKFEGFTGEDGILEGFVYANADELITKNLRVGFHTTEKTIKHKLIIGENGGGDFYLIDLQDHGDESVYYYDHEESHEHYDEETQTWDWKSFEFDKNLSSHVDNLRVVFGL